MLLSVVVCCAFIMLMFLTGFLRAYLRRQDNFVIDKNIKIQDLLSERITQRGWQFQIREGYEISISQNLFLMHYVFDHILFESLGQ